MTRTLSTLLAAFCFTAAAQARPPHKQALADHYGPFLAKQLYDCRTCHLPDPPGTKTDQLVEDKPHNVFGKRLKAIRAELRAVGKMGTIAERLEAVAEEDADGDGVSNLLELLSGHFPGDETDKPTPEEIAQARQTLVGFEKFKNSYPWRPYEIVKRPVIPAVKNTNWVRNPIDAFIAKEHEERGLTPRREAPKHVLLRRVYFDLIGLPPTREELYAFLDDNSTDAYEKVVDRLLQDPRYGERWGRHWMDIWRYSDWAGWTGGNQIRDSQPHIWRWRDWIVESLNQDKPYDRMILEMLAADELCPEDENALRATGYLVRNYKMLSRENWLQDTVDHTFQAFLGTTIGCARCHNHMFDPIWQKEYYQVRAIFEPHNVRIDRIPGQPDTKKDGLVRVFDAAPDAKTYLYVRGDDRNPDKTKELAAGVPEALGGGFPRIEAVNLPLRAYEPNARDFVLQETLAEKAAAATKDRKEKEAAQRRLIAADAAWPLAGITSPFGQFVALQRAEHDLEVARLEVELSESDHAAMNRWMEGRRLERAGQKNSEEWKKLALQHADSLRQIALLAARLKILVYQRDLVVGPANKRAQVVDALKIAQLGLAEAEAKLKTPVDIATVKFDSPGPIYPPTSTGRRLAFARWIADTENPLTARVAVNHIWLRHMGQAIVPSVFDFGRNGRRPTHPALLDWLAAEFMEPTQSPPIAIGGRGAWSMKHLHRLIVTSSTYRMASTSDAKDADMDRDNVYLWRMPSKRLEAELVRDSILYVSGKLDPTMGGPDIDCNLGLTSPRRSLYFRHAQEKQMEFLKIFDCAAVTECYQRKESVLPQQALALANSSLTRQHARLLARALHPKCGDDPAFVTAAFEQVLTRTPAEAELQECQSFLRQQTERFAKGPPSVGDKGDGSHPSPDPALRAREDLVHVLLNHHGFVTVR